MNEPSLKVHRPGLFTTVQDAGRVGYSDVGVTPSGVLNRLALRLANALVGNDPNEACLEVIGMGPALQVEADAVRLALVGATPRASITFSGGQTIAFPANRSVTLHRGDRLSIDQLDGSANAILTVAGGFQIAAVLGSRSTYARGGFGGFHGRALVEGDNLPLAKPTVNGPDQALASDPDKLLYDDGPIRVILGPQHEAFSPTTIEDFLAGTYSIGHESDRMGLRLKGPELDHLGAYEIPSDGIAPGSIQVPGTKQPIVLLVERGTVGGYAKIATVASVDFPRLGRARHGETLRFEKVERAEAEQHRRSQEGRLNTLIAGITSAPPLGDLSQSLLEGVNLISGVWGPEPG
ncbi:MAG: biotin-dependent carboxyltransferase family protein [Pseudomonadota bacterium]